MKERSAALVRSEIVDVPLLGVQVKVSGMMLGERSRVMTEGYKDGVPDYAKLYPLVFGLCVTDPTNGEPVWNPNNLEHVTDINALPGESADAIFAAAVRLSGMDTKGAEGNEPGTTISATS